MEALRSLITHIASVALLGSSLCIACTTDDAEPDDGTGGIGDAGGPAATGGGGASSGGGSGGTSGGGTGGGTTGGTICAAKAVPTVATITDFDACTRGATDAAAQACSLANLGGSVEVLGGLFSYDDLTGNPVFSIVEGQTGGASDNAISLASTDPASEFGGGFGVWTSGCFDATGYSGITFWARGIAPAGTASVSVLMAETTSDTGENPLKLGTCPGTGDDCKPPSASFPVTAEWTQIHVTWAQFTAGNSAGTPIAANGDNIWQFQWDIGLQWVEDPENPGSEEYVPVAAPYELQVDALAFE